MEETATRHVRRYVVEVPGPRLGFHDLAALAERARASAAEVPGAGDEGESDRTVRFIRTIALPEEGSCLLLFEAADVADVERVARRALIRFERPRPVVRLDRRHGRSWEHP